MGSAHGSRFADAGRRRVSWPAALGVAVLASPAPAQTDAPPSRPTLYYIAHTHWEGAVFFTREEYLEIGLPHLLTAMRQLEKHPDYHFTLDQVAYIKPFLDRYPEQAPAFRRFVGEGRLHIVGGMDVMPDDVKPGGELFVRQMQYGKGYCKRELDMDVSVAWLLDTFGHHPQMPQLLSLAGFKSFWFCRGVPDDSLPSEFHWRGIDGTTIPSFWLPGFYGLFYGPPRDPAGFARFFEERYDALNPHVRGLERVGLAGVDVCEPEEDLQPLIRGFNARSDAHFEIRAAGPEQFAQVVAQRSNVPVLDGDFNPIFQGTYSSRIELHQAKREIEQELLLAERLGAIAGWLGHPTHDEDLWRAWEPLLFDQTHDLASGVMTDPVYDETVRSYAFSRRLAEELVDSGWERLSNRIDTRGDGVPVVVFNPHGWPRTDVVTVDVGFSGQDARSVVVADPEGRFLPTQIDSSECHGDGALRKARIAFLATNVPAVGYATYRIRTRPTIDQAAPSSESGDSIENEFYRIAFDVRTGAITSLFDKTTGEETLAAPANVIARQADDGDSWELYHPLDGGMYVASTNQQSIPTSESALSSGDYSGESGSIRRGPVYCEGRASHPFGSGSFATRVRLARGVRRVDFETELVNREKHVRYQALFPVRVEGGRNFQEIPFGAVERPIGVEFPAQNWVDLGDARRGVALLNVGMPGNVAIGGAASGALMLSLMRAVDLIGYNEGRSSETGFELGARRTFRYSIVPHAGDWRTAGVFRQGLEFNRPLLARKASPHAGDLPDQLGLLEIPARNVVMSAFKSGPGGSTIVRLYEATGAPTRDVRIKCAARILDASIADLLEQPIRKLETDGETIRVDLHPFEILTLELQLAGRAR